MEREGCMAMTRLEMRRRDRKADSRADNRLGGDRTVAPTR